jgi:hypothetical protein
VSPKVALGQLESLHILGPASTLSPGTIVTKVNAV